METSIFVTDLAQQFSLSVVSPSHPVVVPLWLARAGMLGFSDQQLASSFVNRSVTTLLQEWPAFRFRAAPLDDDPTLIDRVAA
jgi:hypothetical protein